MKTLSLHTAPKYSAAFCISFNWLLAVEGGNSNHKHDKGGATRFGISQRAYPNLDIAKLTRQQAMMLYHRDYWRASGAKELADNNLPVMALLLLDAAVNHGVPLGVMMLQRVLKVKVDGIFGPQTCKAARIFHCTSIQTQFLTVRATKYTRIAVNNPTQLDFIAGWHKRLFKLQRELQFLPKRIADYNKVLEVY